METKPETRNQKPERLRGGSQCAPATTTGVLFRSELPIPEQFIPLRGSSGFWFLVSGLVPRVRSGFWFLVSGLVLVFSGCGLMIRQATIAYIAVDSQLTPKHVTIRINKAFIEKYQNLVTIRTAFTVDKVMASPLPAALDGDIHFAGRAPQVALPIVAEVANAAEEKAAILVVSAATGSGKSIRVNGVWRIWPEHAGRAKEEQGKPLPPFDTDNPGHVFEIHPVTHVAHLRLLNTFKPVEGFAPGDAERTFGIYQKVPCTLKVEPEAVSIVTETGLYNDVEFVMKLANEPQLVARDGRFVIASALDLHGKLLVERLRLVFVGGTPPEQAVRILKGGGQLHVYGIPRLDFAEITRRMRESPTNPALLTLPLPYEIVILGVYPK